MPSIGWPWPSWPPRRRGGDRGAGAVPRGLAAAAARHLPAARPLRGLRRRAAARASWRYHAAAHGFVCGLRARRRARFSARSHGFLARRLPRGRPPTSRGPSRRRPAAGGVPPRPHPPPPGAGPAVATACSATWRGDRAMTLQDIITSLERYWAERGCLIHQPWDAEVGAGTMHPETFLRVLGPGALEGRLRPALAPPRRRPLRGEPEPALQAPPVPGDPEAGPRRRAGPVPRQPGRPGHRSRRPRRALRGGQLGVADPRGVGHRLAGAARRTGDHAVHLLPAGGRHRPRADLRARSPTAWSGSACTSRTWTTCTTCSGRPA